MVKDHHVITDAAGVTGSWVDHTFRSDSFRILGTVAFQLTE